jgi:two-component system, OmpR family, sensor kinase
VRIPRRPLTLRGRLLAALLVFSAVGLLLFGGASVLLLRHYLLSRIDQQLMHFSVRRVFDTPPRVPSDVRITVFRPDGTTALELGQQPGQSGGPTLPTWDRSSELARSSTPFTVPDLAGSSAWRARAVQLPDGRIVLIAVQLASVNATLGRLQIIECIVGGIILAMIGVVATVVVALGLRPLTRIERTAEAIAGGDLERRVPDSDPRTETGRLGAALNVMLGRLAAAISERERSEQRLRQFVADASHELRTPLTSIRGFAELYRRGGARTAAEIELLTGRIEAEATRMGVLVEDLLLLARLDQERALDITDVDLLVLAADAVHDAQARDPGRPVTLAPGSDAVHVLGDEDKLRQVVSNLVTNALTHTPAGTPVQLTVRAHDASVPDLPPVAQAGELSEQQPAPLGVLEVHDDGPGIPVEAATQIFNRFYSFVPSAHVDADQLRNGNRGGSGLGLAITAAILEAHNGRIELHTAPRQGTTFRVLLPLA